jgi:hypothetical protein
MRRVLPDGFDPRPRPTVDVAPFVQETMTVPVPSRSAEAWATTGSYEPNARAAVLIVQLLATEAPTARFAVAVAADADDPNAAARIAIPLTAAATPTNLFACICFSLSLSFEPSSAAGPLKMGLHPWNPGNAKGKFTVAYDGVIQNSPSPRRCDSEVHRRHDGVIQKFTVATTVSL